MIAIPNRNKSKVNADINIVPYMDVMLVLLVIFIMTTPIIEQGVEIDLPKADSELIDYSEQKSTIITVDKDGNYYISTLENSEDLYAREVVNINQAINMIIARLNIYPNMKVYVRGDKDVYYDNIIKLLSLLEGYVDNIGLITETPELS